MSVNRGYRQCPECYQRLLCTDDLIDEHLKRVRVNGVLLTVRCAGSGLQLQPLRLPFVPL